MTSATATFWLTVVAGLGLGTLIGTLLSGLISSSIGAREREHDRLMREADQEHERKLREASYQHDSQMREEESKRAEAAQRRSERGKAYAELLTTSAMVLHRGVVLRSIGQSRSNTAESVSVMSNQRKPVDPVELDDLLRRDYEPLLRAWTAVWLFGSPEAIEQANLLLAEATQVTGMGTGRAKAQGLSRLLIGEKWTKAQATAWQDAARGVGQARRAFTDVARRELGDDFGDFLLSPREPKAAAKPDILPEPEPSATTAEPPQTEPEGPTAEIAQRENDGAIAELAQPEPDGAVAELTDIQPDGAVAEPTDIEPDGAVAELTNTQPDGAVAELEPTPAGDGAA